MKCVVKCPLLIFNQGGTPFTLDNLQVDASVQYLKVYFGTKQVGAVKEFGGHSWLAKTPRK